jgi:hypothetical protein
MKRTIILILFILVSLNSRTYSQSLQDTSIYLITCAPGTATYSVYGHSAIRVVIPYIQSDQVFNWGIFDFSTPNFAWKFAKGKLDYYLGVYNYNTFMQEYLIENRSVYSQKINLDPREKKILLDLIQTNLLPENRAYKYDFFYDDCSTRIRDLIEKAVGQKLIYPPDETNKLPTFREMVGEYQRGYPWYKLGVDLIMGTPGEAKAAFRDRMFLPIHLQKNLSQAVVNRDRKMNPLLSSTETLLEFDPAVSKSRFFTSPIFFFTLLFILIIFLSAIYRKGRLIYFVDLILFSVFSLLSVLMIFFNFFTDHQQMKWNLNIIWFNPLIIACLFLLIFRKTGEVWFRIVFYLSVVFLPLIIIFPNAINSSFLPFMLILALRSSVHANFKWNPLSIHVQDNSQ